jgi:hypothetical protein
LLCWSIVVVAAVLYPRQIAEKIDAMASAVGYSVGMGALLGVIINTIGVLLGVIFLSALAASARHPGAEGVSLFAGLGALGGIAVLFGAPFWGAVLGALGGLIGGSMHTRSGAAMK